MKNRLTSLLALVAALAVVSSTAVSAAPTHVAAVAIPVRSVNNNGWEISIGTPAQTLLNRFGAPMEKLTENVWVYRGFHPVQKKAQSLNCNTLIVTLTDGAVSEIHIVNSRAHEVITARLQTANGTMVAKDTGLPHRTRAQ